jgi:hypothetical protein
MPQRVWTNRIWRAPLNLLPVDYMLCPIILLYDYLLFIKPSIKKYTGFPDSLSLHFWRFPCHVKLTLNKGVCCQKIKL